ncbi:MAG TPA: DNA translocase FtsK 4TM domain-containing protein [Pirellulales bacterium]|nr:DNA translocase FtsK 4TM domain-containing protein [Pirellulales bacterium]
MPESRNLKADLAALTLLALTVFLAIALATYDPADPPSNLVYPPATEIHNACGRVGAVVARVLFEGLGLGAYYLILSLAVLAAALLRRQEINERGLRAAGWAMSLAGFAALAALAAPEWSPGPVIGSGGYLGAAARGLLEMHFATAGAYILVVSVLAGGLLLSTDYLLVRLSAWAVAGPAKGVGMALGGVGSIYDKRRTRPRTDLAGPNDGEAGAGPQIRISGKIVEETLSTEAKEEPTAAVAKKTDRKAVAAATPDSQPAPEPPASEPRVRPPLKKKDAREEVMQELDAAVSQQQESTDYELPSIELLMESEPFAFEEQEKEVRRKAKILEKTFLNFGFNVKVVEIETGPVIAQFEVELEAGLRLSKITSLADDLAIALRVPSVRIVAPIPGKNTVGIEVPNEERQLVRLREVIEEANGKSQKMRIPIYLGKDVSGNPLVADLATLPHLLIAGRTGTGKSVCLNTIIVSMLMTRRPDEVRMLMIDPKMVELSPYKTLPHLMHPVVTDMRKAEAILAWAVDKMEERYALLARAGVRHISSYNQLGEEELMDRLQPESDEERDNIPTHLPYIVIVADEIADLMMTAAKEVETHIIRLAQKSRAVGIHLVLATQKPTVDVITGLIKSNLPARIAFQVASRTDSRVVLDEMGADKLLGNGDLLFLWPGTSTLLRGQGTYVSDEEINRVVDCVGTTEPEFVTELVQLKVAQAGEADANRFKNRDELYEAAIDIVIREGRGSVSLLQRALGIGYGRGARLIDFMAEDGIVGAYNGSQAREVLITLEQWQEMSGQNAEAAPAPPKRARNKILPSPAKRETADEDDEEEAADEEEDESDEDEYNQDEDEEDGDDEEDGYEGDEEEYDEESYEAESA